MSEALVIWGRLTESFLLNAQLFGLTLLFALPLGLVVAFGSMSRFAPLRAVVRTFVWVIRGTPLMLQIIVIYLGPGLMGWGTPWPAGSFGRLTAAVVAFVINYACYFSEIYRGGIESVPKGQTEAGEVLGMTKPQIFFRVTLPLSQVGMITVGLFYGLSYWNDFYLPLMLITDDSLTTMQYLLYRMMGNLQFLVSNSNSSMVSNITPPMQTAKMAMSVLAIGPIILVYPFIQKYFVKGVIVGAIKG